MSKKRRKNKHIISISEIASEAQERKQKDEAKRLAEEQREKAEGPENEKKIKEHMLKTAFVPKIHLKISIVLFFIVAAGIISYTVIKYPDANNLISVFILLGTIASSSITAVIFFRLSEAWFIKRGNNWLNQFPYPWNKEVYIKILSGEYFSMKLIVHILFYSDINTEKQEQITTAFNTLSCNINNKKSEIQWIRDDFAELSGPEINAYIYHHIGGYEAWNRDIHLWFLSLTNHTLSVLNIEFPIKYVDFSIESKGKQQIFSQREDFQNS